MKAGSSKGVLKGQVSKRLLLIGLILGSVAIAIQQLNDPVRQEQLVQIKKHGMGALSVRLPKADLSTRLKEFRPIAQPRLKKKFKKVGLSYPPSEITMVGLKEEKRLEVYAREKPAGKWVLVDDLPILGASGKAGPKLKEGDRQVPEGIYRVEFLNPNSRFHLSLRLNYPNEFDRTMAAKDGRTNLGGDIMIHGGALSIGCLAMGDPIAEELFVLVADVGMSKTTVVLTPYDFRKRPAKISTGVPSWTGDLYKQIEERLKKLAM